MLYVFVGQDAWVYGHVWVLRIARMEMLVSNAMLLDFFCESVSTFGLIFIDFVFLHF